MTEQEAEVWVARLTRVWTPESYGFEVNFEGANNSTDFEFHASLADGVALDVVFGDTYSYSHEDYRFSKDGASLLCEDGQLSSWTYGNDRSDGWQDREQAFASKWMGCFRRNCWLSGATVEASAHEKAEWIQGFTREELEAWNLKL